MPQSLTRSIRWRVAVPLLYLLGLIPAVAAAVDAPSGQGLEALEQRLEALQRRVERLEEEMAKGVPVDRARTVQPVPGGWRKAANWRLLAAGMSDYEVVEILGEPDAERTVKKFEFWDYGDGGVNIYLRRLKSWRIPSGLDPH
jgi:hypothetical protein